MIDINCDIHAPSIGLAIEENIHSITNLDECALLLRLSYQENSTLFLFNSMQGLYFKRDFLEVRLNNNSTCYLDYKEIFEYAIVNKNDLKDLDDVGGLTDAT